jgi:hypothetical protein
MKHGYGNLGAVPVPGTAEVRVQPGYRCMRTPGVPHFFKKKKKFQVRVGYGLGTGWVRARLKVAKNDVVFRQKYSTLSLSLYHPPSAATLTSSAYRRRCTVSSDLDLRRRKISGCSVFRLPFLFTGHLSLSPLGLKAEAPFSLCLSFQAQTAFFSLFTFHSSNSFNMWS